MFNWQHGDNAAANVQESAKRFQPRHPAGQHSPRRQVLQKVLHGFLLSRPAGQPGNRRALPVGFQRRDGETGLLPDPGQYGNVPAGTADPGGNGFLTGNPAFYALQRQVQGVVCAAALGRRF